MLSKRSPTYKEMKLDSRKLSKSEAIDLMLAEPNLMRRPLLLVKGKSLLGYDREAYEALG